MQLIPIPTPLVKLNANLPLFLSRCLKTKIKDGDILAVTAKIVSLAEGAVVNLSTINAGEKARALARKSALPPEFCQVVLDQAQQIFTIRWRALLTLKNQILTPNAGIDQANMPEGQVVLWPKDPEKSAVNLQRQLKQRLGLKNLGVLIIDSNCWPRRNGTNAVALAAAGFQAVADERGKPDLFGNLLQITQRNVADMLAAAANYLMGDRDEKIPVVLLRRTGVTFTNQSQKRRLIISKEQCLFGD